MTLTAENLHDTLRSGRPVIDIISLRLRTNSVAVVLGPNGAGKTTLLRILAGLHSPARGSVSLDGQSLAAIDRRERARRIGYLAQGGRDQWNLHAHQIVALGRLPHRARFAAQGARDEAAIAGAMARTDTTHLRDRTIAQLSGGERARVHLARVLATEPEWLLADEPLADLDPPQQMRVLGLLAAAARAGAGVVAVLHDLNAAAIIADTVTLLREGQLVAHGPARDVLTPALLEQAYGAPFDVEQRADGRLSILARAALA